MDGRHFGLLDVDIGFLRLVSQALQAIGMAQLYRMDSGPCSVAHGSVSYLFCEVPLIIDASLLLFIIFESSQVAMGFALSSSDGGVFTLCGDCRLWGDVYRLFARSHRHKRFSKRLFALHKVLFYDNIVPIQLHLEKLFLKQPRIYC